MRHSPSFAAVRLLALFALTGCMSIVGNDHQLVMIETDPAGAEAVSAGGERCTTPCELNLPRMKDQAVCIEKEGFHPVEAAVTGHRWRKGIAASVAGNLAFGAVLAVTGAAVIVSGDLEDGLGLTGTGLAVALGGGTMADTSNGVLLKLTPNPLQVVLVPKGDEEPDERHCPGEP